MSSEAPIINFRAATQADQPQLFEIFASSRREEFACLGWDPSQMQAFLLQQFQAQHAAYQDQWPDAQFLVIEIDGLTAGCLYRHWSAGVCHIIDLALLPEYRGAGLGARLLTATIDEAREAAAKVTLRVRQDNPAQRLYHRLGFRVEADEGIHLLMGRAPDGPPRA